MAESPLSLVFLPQYRAVSGKWFPNWGYDFQSAWVLSNGMGTGWMPLTGLAHKNLQLNSFLFFNLIFGVEDDGVFISLGLWMTAWITLLFPSSSSPSHCQWGFTSVGNKPLSSCKPLRLESISARKGSYASMLKYALRMWNPILNRIEYQMGIRPEVRWFNPEMWKIFHFKLNLNVLN